MPYFQLLLHLVFQASLCGGRGDAWPFVMKLNYLVVKTIKSSTQDYFFLIQYLTVSAVLNASLQLAQAVTSR